MISPPRLRLAGVALALFVASAASATKTVAPPEASWLLEPVSEAKDP